MLSPTRDRDGGENVAADDITFSVEDNSAGMAPALTTTHLFDSIAIRINGPKAWSESLSINWIITDENRRYRTELSNGAARAPPSEHPSRR